MIVGKVSIYIDPDSNENYSKIGETYVYNVLEENRGKDLILMDGAEFETLKKELLDLLNVENFQLKKLIHKLIHDAHSLKCSYCNSFFMHSTLGTKCPVCGVENSLKHHKDDEELEKWLLRNRIYESFLEQR